MEIWSNSVIYFPSGLPNNYFSSALTQAYGRIEILPDSSPLRFALYIGDINQDRMIDAPDLSGVDNNTTAGLKYYV